jgi:hypothetical protein
MKTINNADGKRNCTKCPAGFDSVQSSCLLVINEPFSVAIVELITNIKGSLMKQKDIQDRENVTWTCVQAFSGGDSGAAQEAEQHAIDANGNVPVVCTPSGGGQSLRLQLPVDWYEQMTETTLLAAIDAARG